MAVWKVMVIGFFACACLALATATFIVSFPQDGKPPWLMVAGLSAGTLATIGLFVLFLRHAGNDLDLRPRGVRN